MAKKQMDKIQAGRKILKYLLFSIILGILLTGLGLLDVHYYMAPFSEEAGLIGRGFPHTIIESGPFFAGYGGLLANEGGREYYLNAPGAFSNPHLDFTGLAMNIIINTLLGFFLVVIGIYRKTLIGRIKNFYSSNGTVKSSLLLVLFGFFLLTLLFLGFYFIMMAHTAFRMMSGP